MTSQRLVYALHINCDCLNQRNNQFNSPLNEYAYIYTHKVNIPKLGCLTKEEKEEIEMQHGVTSLSVSF